MITSAVAGILTLGGSLPPASAADLGTSEPPAISDPVHPFFRHRLLLQGGAAFNNLDSTVQVGRAGATSGTPLSLEDDLGLAKQYTSLDAMLRLRMGGRWNMELSYFGISRGNSATANRTIEFGRLDFPATATVGADFELSAYRLGFGYAFYKTSQTEVGGALSLFVHDFSASAYGSAAIGGLSAGFQTEKYSVVAPLPTIGLFAHHAFTSKWLVSGRLDYVDLSIDSLNVLGLNLRDAGGRILSIEASSEYRLLENLAIGAGYRYQDVSFGATVSGLRGQLAYTTSAPIVFVRTSF